MSEEIEEFKALRAKISEIDNPEDTDYGLLDKFLRSIKLSIKHCFGLQSEYIDDLKEIEKSFPKDPGYLQFTEEQEYQYVTATTSLENLIDTIIADLEKSPNIKVNRIQNKIKKHFVFIVHGTDYGPVKELKAILQELGLKPIILHEQPSKGMTLIEKLEEYSDVGYAFIILTPDDLGLSSVELYNSYKQSMNKEKPTKEEIQEYLKNNLEHKALIFYVDLTSMLKSKARQNVILEFGYFIGRLGRCKVCCLYKGDIELPSDMHGICYLHFNNSINEVKDAIIEELKAANYP